jgi:hypothetical protein
MTGRLLVAVSVVVAAAQPLRAQSAGDSAAIRQAASDYIQGWYTGDGDRMARSLHPELAKRIQNQDPQGRVWIRDMTSSELVRATRAGAGTQTPAAERRAEVRILDIFQGTASVRLDAATWIDYMHLARQPDGRWLIVNVLWDTRR